MSVSWALVLTSSRGLLAANLKIYFSKTREKNFLLVAWGEARFSSPSIVMYFELFNNIRVNILWASRRRKDLHSVLCTRLESRGTRKNASNPSEPRTRKKTFLALDVFFSLHSAPQPEVDFPSLSALVYLRPRRGCKTQTAAMLSRHLANEIKLFSEHKKAAERQEEEKFYGIKWHQRASHAEQWAVGRQNILFASAVRPSQDKSSERRKGPWAIPRDRHKLLWADVTKKFWQFRMHNEHDHDPPARADSIGIDSVSKQTTVSAPKSNNKHQNICDVFNQLLHPLASHPRPITVSFTFDVLRHFHLPWFRIISPLARGAVACHPLSHFCCIALKQWRGSRRGKKRENRREERPRIMM